MSAAPNQNGLARLLERLWGWLRDRFGRTETSTPSTTGDVILWADLVAWFRQPDVMQVVSVEKDRVAFTILAGPDASVTPLRGLRVGSPPRGYTWTLVQGVYDERTETVLEPCRVVHARAIDDEVRSAHVGKTLVLYR